MISEMTENASSNPAKGVTQGSRREGSTCAISRWLVLGSGAGPGAGSAGADGVEGAAGDVVRRGTSILAIPFLESAMVTNYRDEPAFFNLAIDRVPPRARFAGCDHRTPNSELRTLLWRT